MSSRHSYMISISSLKNFHSINRSLPKCKLNWFRIQGYSKSLKDHSIISLKNVREVSLMNSLFKCTVGFIRLAEWWLPTRAMLRRCSSSDKGWLRCTITRTMRSTKRSRSCICQSTLISEITRSYTTWSPTLFSKLWRIRKTTRGMQFLSRCLISISCAFPRIFCLIYATSSLKPLKISREDHWKEDTDSCNKRILTLEDMNKRRNNKKVKLQPMTIPTTAEQRDTSPP